MINTIIIALPIQTANIGQYILSSSLKPLRPINIPAILENNSVSPRLPTIYPAFPLLA